MHPRSRRQFISHTAAVSLGFLGLGKVRADEGGSWLIEQMGYGPLVPDPAGKLDLPAGFTYRTLSLAGTPMDDGLLVPGRHDGMAAFPGPMGTTILMRNHEIAHIHTEVHSPWGDDWSRWRRINPDLIWDRGRGMFGHPLPCRGGVTRITYDTRRQRVVEQHLALAGTEYNCAGGPTPWQSWISCEEYVTGPEHGAPWTKRHGYCFDVPVQGTGLCRPEPIIPMGRFRHEAVAVDPRTGVIYLTEDREDGVFFRFIPDVHDRPAEGGRLQALCLDGCASADTRDWDASMPLVRDVPESVHWIDVEDVDSHDDSLRYQCYKRGAARFARAEGCWMGDNEVWFACTTGGRTKHGQLMRYRPSRFEGTPGEDAHPGSIELFLQPDDPSVIENADNITMAPWGDIIVCEDGSGGDRLLGVTPSGKVYRIAANRASSTEFAGACFSPDGTTLFVNQQKPGVTLAITGPWRNA
ncbi:MAG: PhoX family protein [Phycisphaerales bacterium]|nr:PhoX family protein [Phycisphaerales bacterium]